MSTIVADPLPGTGVPASIRLLQSLLQYVKKRFLYVNNPSLNNEATKRAQNCACGADVLVDKASMLTRCRSNIARLDASVFEQSA
jgi:hypothetical protein